MRTVFCYWNRGVNCMPPPIKIIYERNCRLLKLFGLKFRLVSDENASEFVGILPDFFENLSPNHKSDFLRWEILYKHGGVWLDTDIILYKDITPLFEKLYNFDSVDVLLNIEYRSKIHNILQENCVEELVVYEDFYIKPACCVVFAKPKSDFIKFCKENTLEKISSSLHLDWWDIGPCMTSKAYRNNKSLAYILNNSEMDELGFNAVTWKVDLSLPTILTNYPGYNKSQWYGSPSTVSQKAKRMMLNENFFYLPIWSIHKRNNGDQKNIESVLFQEERSLFYQLNELSK